MGHHHGRARPTTEEGLQAVKARKVQVVGGFVEQEHVEAGEQHRRQAGPGRLTTGDVGDRNVEPVGGQPEVAPDRGHPGVEVIPAEGQKKIQRLGVRIHHRRVTGHGGGQPVQLVGRGRDASALGQVGAHRLGRRRVRLLAEVPDP